MTLPSVAIALNIIDAAGNEVTDGSAVFTPTSKVQTGDGLQEIAPAPITIELDSGDFPVSALLCPTDLAGATPAGWAWQVAFPGVPGGLQPFTFKAPSGPTSFTAATGTPGVVTWTATSALTALPNGTGVKLTGGSLPTGVTAGTVYYVTGVSGQTLHLSATPGGSAVAFTSTGSGTLTVASYYLAALVPVGSVAALSPYLLSPSAVPTAGQALVATGTGSGTAWHTLTASDVGADPAGSTVPVSQSFTLANNAYKPLQEWTVTGQADDPLPSFGLVAASQTYAWASGGESTQGPAFFFGYNPRHLSGMVASSAHGALGVSAFADAGDTWNPATGAHGLEFNVAWSSPTGAKGVAPVQVVGAGDETRTVTLALRCGDGHFTTHDGTPYVSGITMSDAGGTTYLTAGPFNNSAYGSVTANTAPGVTIGAPLALTSMPYLFAQAPAAMTASFAAAGTLGSGSLNWSAVSNHDTNTVLWQGQTGTTHTIYSVAGPAVGAVTSSAGLATSSVTAAGANNPAKFQATSPAGTAQFILNGNAATSSQMVFQKNSANTWILEDSAGASFLLTNNSGNPQMLLTSGTNTAGNYDNAVTGLLSKVQVYGSLAVTSGSALATTATAGFLYIPSCAGTPTGTPAANAGSVPLVYDTTGNQLNVYRGGAWHAVTV